MKFLSRIPCVLHPMDLFLGRLMSFSFCTVVLVLARIQTFHSGTFSSLFALVRIFLRLWKWFYSCLMSSPLFTSSLFKGIHPTPRMVQSFNAIFSFNKCVANCWGVERMVALACSTRASGYTMSNYGVLLPLNKRHHMIRLDLSI